MAGLDFSFTDKSQTQTTQQDTTTQQITEQEQLSQQQQTSEAAGVTTALDLETQKLVKDLIGSLSSGLLDAEGSQLPELASMILERSKTAQEDITAQIAPIIEGARYKGEQELTALQTQLAQQSGGSIANTLVASATGAGRAELESSLARAEAELNLQGRAQATAELTSAVSGITQAESAPLQNISGLLNILKGATVEEAKTAEQLTVDESTLSSILDSITKTTGTSTSKESGTSLDLGFANI